MRHMPIYAAEREAGLADILSDPLKCSITFASKLFVPDESNMDLERTIASKSKQLKSITATNFNQMDLYYINSILVTVGWNSNDDVFMPVEVWAARHTPEDKMFNFEHDPAKIIGHITGCRVIDDSGLLVAEESDADGLPDKFHILTSAVVYRHLASKKPELTEAAAEIIEGIQEGLWFVSMEALFSDFDYAVIHANGSHEVVPRNKETAFLTKHLRSYGGKGVYGNRKIGRAVKNLTFSGKGLVEKPANPESVIFDDVETFRGVFSIVSTQITSEKPSEENNPMPDARTESGINVEQLQQTVAELKGRLQQLDEEKIQSKYDQYEKTIAGLKADVEDRETKIKDFESRINSIGASETEAKSKVDDLQKKLEETEATLKAKTEELNKIAAEAVKASRVSTLVDKGVEKDKAEQLVAKFVALDDDQFADIVTVQAELAEIKKAQAAGDKPNDDDAKKKEKDKKKKAEASEEVDAAAASADPDALDDAEEEGEPSLQTAGETDEEVEGQVVASLSQFLASKLGQKTGRGSKNDE